MSFFTNLRMALSALSKPAQRVVLPVSAVAGAPVDLELAPTVYERGTPQIVLRWGVAQSPPGA